MPVKQLSYGHGFGEKYASVKRFVRKLRGSSTPEARVVIETAPVHQILPNGHGVPAFDQFSFDELAERFASARRPG